MGQVLNSFTFASLGLIYRGLRGSSFVVGRERGMSYLKAVLRLEYATVRDPQGRLS